MIIYFIIIGNILASFAVAVLKEQSPIFTSRGFYVVIVGALLSVLIFKRQMHELKIASILLFIAILLFIVVFTFQLVTAGTD